MGAISAFLVAIYARGPDSYVRVNDHLDGIVPLYVVLAASQPIVGGLHDRVDAIFDGLPRNSMPTTLHLGALLYYVLPPFWAHAVHEGAIRLLAYAGMALLLRRLLPEAGNLVLHGPSVCFALLPFLPSAYLSVAGQPLLLVALLNLRRARGSPWDWLVVAVFPLYSSLAFIGFFVLLGVGLLVLHDGWRLRRVPVRLVVAGALLAVLYAGSEYRLLYQTLLDPVYVSHRSEFLRTQGSLRHAAQAALRTFFLDHHHASSLQLPILLPTALAALGAGLAEVRRRTGSIGPRALASALRAPPAPVLRWRGLVLALSLCGAASLLVGLWEWEPVQAVVESPFLGPLRMFNFHRVAWFQPALFGLAFAFALHELWRRRWAGPAAVLALVAAQAAWAISNSNGLAEKRASGLTFSAYYSTPLFSEIRDHVGRPPGTYRVVSLGLTPGIALYNGFSVLDGFVNDYPLEYKRRFRRVIAGELEKDPFLAGLFDDWGGHVDLFSSELGKVSGYSRHVYTKHAERRAVEHLEIDLSALRELGGDYVLSTVEIRNHDKLGLSFERSFERVDSPWQIFLYSLGEHRASPTSSASEKVRADSRLPER